MTDKIFESLLEGNKRFYNGKSTYPNNNQETRDKFLKKQTPMAIVIACSDSRAPVELLFDVGIGDLFVIRSAGHILTESEMASLEYAIEHLDVKLVIVMGHSGCGAVSSALNHKEEEHLSQNMSVLINRIKPVIERAKKDSSSEKDLLENCVNGNVYETIDYIKQDEVLMELIREKEVKIIATKYDIKTGKVEKI